MKEKDKNSVNLHVAHKLHFAFLDNTFAINVNALKVLLRILIEKQPKSFTDNSF